MATNETNFIEKGTGGPAFGSAVPVEPQHKKITIEYAPGDDTSVTFKMYKEDHTLGNALRYVLAKKPEVQLVGYTIPHPFEPHLHLHVQTHAVPATKCFSESIETLENIFVHISSMFDSSLEEFKGQMDV